MDGTASHFEEYEELKVRLEAKTGIKNINEIIDLYSTYKVKNEQLYLKISHLNDEKDALDIQIKDLQTQIDNYKKTTKGLNYDIDPREVALQEVRVSFGREK
jgi:hypothetical protein